MQRCTRKAGAWWKVIADSYKAHREMDDGGIIPVFSIDIRDSGDGCETRPDAMEADDMDVA